MNNEKAQKMLETLKKRKLFRAAMEAGKIEFVTVNGKGRK